MYQLSAKVKPFRFSLFTVLLLGTLFFCGCSPDNNGTGAENTPPITSQTTPMDGQAGNSGGSPNSQPNDNQTTSQNGTTDNNQKDNQTTAAGNNQNGTQGTTAGDSQNGTANSAGSAPAQPGFTLIADADGSYEISDMLYGLFLEDINYAVDGGLYAELVKNRSFEYGKMATGGSFHGWKTVGSVQYEVIDGSADASCLNENNPSYLRLTVQSPGSGVENSGFLSGMAVEAGKDYYFSVFLKSETFSAPLTVRLTNKKNTIYAEAVITPEESAAGWWKYETTLTASETVTSGLYLALLFDEGTVDLDMVSLLPADTYHNRKNGVRADMAKMLEELNPAFLRFPGGCIIEGKSLKNAYSWKDSIGNGMKMTINGKVTVGDVATRPLGIDLWGNENQAAAHPYYMTYGFGFYEFFELCEDLGCEPVPILNCGVSCLIQGIKEAKPLGSDEFQQYVQDALDLVEFCLGDETTYWGSVRTAMGHPGTFPLHYIGIGNEQWGSVYFSHYEQFLNAFDRAAKQNPALYGDIKLIVANGPAASDRYAWNEIEDYGPDYAGLVDEHYYMSPDWFLANNHRYDSYDRNSVPVFLGEYAAQSNTMRAALAEASYMTGLERNGDIVHLAAYAPLFSNPTASQWSPDLIWFNNNTVWGSANYYVQKLFATNKCTKVAAAEFTGSAEENTTLSGKIGVGTWMTSATFDDIVVTDNQTGEILFSEDFSGNSLQNWDRVAGAFNIADGKLVQSNQKSPSNSVTGDVMYAGSTSWTDYTLTLKATKTGGAEGFLIPIAVQDAQNFYHWNIGGWGNTVSSLEITSGNSKSGQVAGTVRSCKIKTGTEYEIKVVVSGSTIKGYLNGTLYLSYEVPRSEVLYQVTGTDADGDVIIKLVNTGEAGLPVHIVLKNFGIHETTAALTVLSGMPTDQNNSSSPEKVSPVTGTLAVSEEFDYMAPGYSVVVIRIAK